MPVSEESSKLRVVVSEHFPHLSYRWLRWLNEKIGRLEAENGGFFDLTAIFRGYQHPPITRITTEHKPLKLND